MGGAELLPEVAPLKGNPVFLLLRPIREANPFGRTSPFRLIR